MNSTKKEQNTIKSLKARIKAQQKTIEVLMDTVEGYSSQGATSLELLSENLNLEQIVQRKTARLRQQGDELKKALHELKLTQAQLLQASKLEAVGQLAAGIAHEINTPAQFIGLNVDFLNEAFSDIQSIFDSLKEQIENLEPNNSPETIKKILIHVLTEQDWEYLSNEIPTAIGQARDGIGRISTIVQAMKEFSHPQGKEKSKNDLNRIIETSCIVASSEWKYSSELQTDLDPDLPLILCLADELGQVILNILINAAHANEEKMSGLGSEEKGTITISTKQDQEQVMLTISDTGNGIPEEIQDRIFEPFFTTKSVNKGSGQGLTIARNIVTKKHGGTIEISSEPGKGTTFLIKLPID